jgi:hypothetical protein
LWLRLVGATAAGWMADRMGRKTPLKLQSEYQRMEIPVFLQPLRFCSLRPLMKQAKSLAPGQRSASLSLAAISAALSPHPKIPFLADKAQRLTSESHGHPMPAGWS